MIDCVCEFVRGWMSAAACVGKVDYIRCVHLSGGAYECVWGSSVVVRVRAVVSWCVFGMTVRKCALIISLVAPEEAGQGNGGREGGKERQRRGRVMTSVRDAGTGRWGCRVLPAEEDPEGTLAFRARWVS